MPSVKLSTGGFFYGPDPDPDHGFDTRLAPRPVAEPWQRHRLDLSGHDRVDPGELQAPVAKLIGEADQWCSDLQLLEAAPSLRHDMESASNIWRGWAQKLARYAEPPKLSRQQILSGQAPKACPVSGSITHLLGEDFRRFAALVLACRAAVALSASSMTSLVSGPPARSPFSFPTPSGPGHDPERPSPRS